MGLSFKIQSGEIVGLLGPKWSRKKQATMRMLTTFLLPSRGTARVAGFDILEEADSVPA